MRRLLLGLLGMAYGGSGLASDAVVLMYHRFGEDRYPSTSVTLEQFEAHLDHLASGDYNVVPLGDLLGALSGGLELADNAIVITIDDAFLSVYEQAYPRLAARGWPFTVFVASDPVDQGLADYMSWEQMREMADHGASYANHGATHESLLGSETGEPAAARRTRIRDDIERGQRRLEVELEPLSGVFAYPFGEYDELATEVLTGLAYMAFGQQSGAVGATTQRLALPRYPMAEVFAGLDDFATKVRSRSLPVIDVEPLNQVTTDPRPRVLMTLGETDARLEQLACYVSGQGQAGVEWLETGRRFAVQPERDLLTGRSRVNCTAPAAAGNRFHWFSHPWFFRDSAN